MCLLTFLPAGIPPDTSALRNGAEFNDDGHGFAIVAGDEIIVRHSLTAEPLIDQFAGARRQYPDGPALFHSRLSTHGAEHDLANCHPFTLGGDPRTVLAHNGILPAAVRPRKGDPRSDTRIAAETFLPGFGSLRLRRNRLRAERWMTKANKIVILTVDRRYRDRAYILNADAGIWDAGIWYSNDGYLPYVPRWTAADYWSPDGPADPVPDWADGHCCVCHTAVELTDATCPYCGGCPLCGEWRDDCGCYAPNHLDNGVVSRPV
jgi:hypothetical protein